MPLKLTNNAYATLAAGINSSVLAFTVAAGLGARFPTLAVGDYMIVTLINASNNIEIVKVSSRTGDVFTVATDGRGYDGSTARAWITGDLVEVRVPRRALEDAVNGAFNTVPFHSAARFGFVGDGVTNNNAAWVLAMAAIALTGGTLYFPPGDYVYSDGLVFDGVNSVTIEGAGLYVSAGVGTRLKYTGTGVAITKNSCAHFNLVRFWLQGTVSANGGILDGTSLVSNYCDTRQVYVTGFTKAGAYGAKIVASIRNSYTLCDFAANYNGLVIDGETADNTEYHSCVFRNNTNYGLYIHNGYSHTFFNCNAEYNTLEGVYISAKGPLAPSLQSVEQIAFHNLWVEGNNSGGVAEVLVTSDIAAADTKSVTFYNFYEPTTPAATYIFQVARATGVGLISPKLISWGHISATSTAVGAYAITFEAASTAGGGYMKLFGPGVGAQELTANSATPSATMNLGTYYTNSSAPTAITNFTGGVDGHKIHVNIKEAFTSIVNSASILTTNARTILGVGAQATFVFDGASSVWREISRNNISTEGLTYSLATTVTGYLNENTEPCMLMITDVTANKSALYSLNGSLNTTTEMSDPDAGFQNATGGAVIAIYHDGATSYRVKNEYGVTHVLVFTIINSRTR